MKTIYLFASLIAACLVLTCCSLNNSSKNKVDNPKENSKVLEEKTGNYVVAYIMAGYYKPNTIRWHNITHLNLAFIYPNEDGTISDYQVKNILPELINEAHKNNVKVVISIRDEVAGRFSKAIANHRSKLADNLLAFVKDNNLDGYDIDYEDWTGENTPENLFAFIKELYEKKDKDMLQTCAVNTFDRGYTTEWHKYFDIINIMAYDEHGPWNDEGQHSPYEGSINSIDFWKTSLQAPAEKLTLGLPFYGYSWNEGDTPGEAYWYQQILEKYPDKDVPNLDQIDHLYYNGKATIEKKCRWAKENKIGGVMIWQIGQDAYDSENSLLEAIGKIMR